MAVNFDYNSLVNQLKPIAQKMVSASMPAVQLKLQQIAGDVFRKGVADLSNISSTLPNPNVNLTYRLAPPLSGVTQDQMTTLLNQLNGRTNQRYYDAYGNVISTPMLPSRGTLGSSTAAATAYYRSLGIDSQRQTTYSGFDSSAGLRIPAMPTAAGRDLRDPNEMAKFQEDFQAYTQAMSLRSQIQSMLHDTRKLIVQNFRA